MSKPSTLERYLDQEEFQKYQQKLSRESTWKLLARLLRYRSTLTLAVILVLVATCASISEPLMLAWIIDHALIRGDFHALKIGVIGYACVQLVRYLATIAEGVVFGELGQKVMFDLRQDVMGHLQRLPLRTYDRVPVGKLVTRATNDISALSDLFSSGVMTIGVNALVVLGTLGAMVWLDPVLGGWVLFLMVGVGITILKFSQSLRIVYRNVRSRLSALNAMLAESIMGMKIIQLFGRERVMSQRYRDLNQWYSEAQLDSVFVYSTLRPVLTIQTGLVMAVVLGVGGQRVSTGELAVGTWVAFFSYTLALFEPLFQITDKWNMFLSGAASAERVFSLLDWETEQDLGSLDRPRRELRRRFGLGVRGEIRFENVWFSYETTTTPERWVLKDFSAVIESGQQIGIVGETGSGKSTLLSLLLRFYDPQRGTIRIDGVDIREIEKRELRSVFGMIQQDVMLFSGTCQENLTLWREGERPVGELIERVGLAHKLDLALEERGNNLSVGERQTLSFARAQQADPWIWILDEATASVDSRSEERLMDLLEAERKSRTALLVAHRLSTVQSCDQIWVLHQGKLIEQGTHPELLNKGGAYARLCKLQSMTGPASE